MKSVRYLMCMCAILLAGCSATSGGVPSTTGLPRVLAAETFLGDIAQNVAGDRLKVDVLLSPGIDPHEFQMSPQDAIKVAQSRVLILNGIGYENWLNKTLQESQGQHLVVIASDGLGQTPDADPHMWMNPLNVVRYAQNIRDGLTTADPEGAAVYAANAEAYVSKLTDLDAWIKSQVDAIPPERRLLVTNHAELGFLASAYGFKIIGAVIPNVSNEAAPSAQEMASLIQAVKASRAPAIFVDLSENPGLARQIASESGAQVVTDLYVESLSAPNGPAATYIEMMKHDVGRIVGALR